MHLTNYSLNVHSGNFVHSDSQNTGSKRTLSSVLYRLAAKGVDIKKVWSDIIALVIKTVIAVVPELKVYYHADIPPGKPGPTCFQVSGILTYYFCQSHYHRFRNLGTSVAHRSKSKPYMKGLARRQIQLNCGTLAIWIQTH